MIRQNKTKYFMGEFCDYHKARVIIVPVPLEKSTSYLKGTARGPAAIIEASYNVELYDIELEKEPYRQGIATLSALNFLSGDSIPVIFEKITSTVEAVLADKKFPVLLGGEHTLSFPAFLAFQKFFPDLSILHIDAHSDLRQEYLGDPYSHACVMRRIREHTSNLVSIGIRSLCQDEADYIKKEKPVIFYDHQIQSTGLPVEKILAHLTDNVYISFDLDGINPAEMPAVGTPEPGGLSWFQVVELFRKLFQTKNVVGADVVELKPDKVNLHADFWAAKIIYKMIGLKFLS